MLYALLSCSFFAVWFIYNYIWLSGCHGGSFHFICLKLCWAAHLNFYLVSPSSFIWSHRFVEIYFLSFFFFLLNLDRVSNVDLLNFQSDWWKHLLENIYHLERPFQPLPTFLVPAFRWKRAKMDTASARKPIEMKRLARLILVDYSNVVNSFVLLHPVMTN